MATRFEVGDTVLFFSSYPGTVPGVISGKVTYVPDGMYTFGAMSVSAECGSFGVTKREVLKHTKKVN
jgi:hypothetical protein